MTRDTIALTELQHTMLLDSLVAPREGGYVLQNRFRLDETLDVTLLERAWEAVFARRAVSRTMFVASRAVGDCRVEMESSVTSESRATDVRQSIAGHVNVRFERRDLRSLDATARGEALAAFLAEDRAQPFAHGAPPQRFALFRHAEAAYELVWTTHHATMDGRSYLVLASEAFLSYDALRAGLPLPPLSPPERPFADYVAWAAAKDRSDEERHWRGALAGFIAPTALPRARERPLPRGDEAFGGETLRLSETLTATALAIAKERGLTVNAFVHATWALLLAKYGGGCDVVFGSTRGSRRAPPGMDEPLPLGLVLATLPLRVTIDPQATANDLVRSVGEGQRALRDVEHSPFSVIRSASEVPEHLPIFESVVVFNDATFDGYLRARGGPAWAHRECIVEERPHLPLHVTASLATSLIVRIGYFRRRFEDATIAALAQDYAALFAALVTAPDTTVADILTPANDPRNRALTTVAALAAFAARILGEEEELAIDVRDERPDVPSPEAIPTGPILAPSLRERATAADHATALARAPATDPAAVRAVVGFGSDGTPYARFGLADAADERSAVLDRFLEGARAGGALHDLPITSPTFAARLSAWNDTTAPIPEGGAHDLFRARTRLHPEAPALIFGETTWTYGTLAAKVDALATHLTARGIGRGDRVGVFLERSGALVVALLAVLETGAAYVPLDPIYPRDRIAFMLHDAETALVVTEASLVSSLDEATATASIDRDGSLAGRAPTPLDEDGTRPAADALRAEPAKRARATPDDLAYVIYTSGSTGQPKGVAVHHRALVNLLASMAREPGFTARDTMLAVTTVSFDIAALELFLPLVTGGTVEIASAAVAANPFDLRRRIEGGLPTVVQATPATWRMLVAVGFRGHERLKILCGGERLDPDLARELTARAAEVWNMYGPTETTIWSSVSRVHEGAPITIGRPIANTTFYVLDARGRVVPVGTPGELAIGGASVARGYHRRGGLTAERFGPRADDASGERLYRTGDRALFRSDGSVECRGRLDTQVKLNGYRIELGEIEATLRAHPRVEGAIVTVDEGAPGEKVLVAYVVVPDGEVAEIAPSLRAHLRAVLPAYMIPSHFVPIAQVPVTPNGKIDRRSVPPVAFGTTVETTRPAALSQGRDEGERVELVAAIWRRILQNERIGYDDNFFDVGGKSLTLMQIVGTLRDRFGVELTSTDMLRSPTVRTMARLLRGATAIANETPPSTTHERRPTDAPLAGAEVARRNGLLALRRRRAATLSRTEPTNPSGREPRED